MLDQSHYTRDNPLVDLFYRRGKRLNVKSQECVIQVGQTSNRVFLVLYGGFVCQNYDPESDQYRTINFHTNNFHPLMTVLDSYFRDVASTCQLKAFKRSEILVLSKKGILAELDKEPNLKESYMEETIYALTVINEFHTKLITLNTKNMYKYLTRDCPQLLMQVPDKYIAEFIGIRPEWLSQIKQEL